MRMKTSSGLSLIELLVAITLLSMVILTGYYAYSIIATSWQKQSSVIDAQLDHRSELRKLDAVLKGIMPWTIRNKDNQGAFFFVGKQDSLLAVTSNGLFDDQYPEIFRLVVQQDADGSAYLLYQATSSQHVSLVNSSQSIEFGHEMVLLNEMSNFQFNYFGASQLTAMTVAPDFTWSNEFSGLDRQLMPYQLMLKVVKGQYELRLRAGYQYNSAKLLSGYLDDGVF